MKISLICNKCSCFNTDCKGMSNNFTGCIYYKNNKKQ